MVDILPIAKKVALAIGAKDYNILQVIADSTSKKMQISVTK